MRILSVFLLSLNLWYAARTPARGAVVVVAPTASTAGNLQITDDITFTIATAGAAGLFVMDEWVITDGTRNTSTLTPRLSVSINGAAPGANAADLYDGPLGAGNAITLNDGYLLLTNAPIAVSIGNTLTLRAGTYSLAMSGGFNPMGTQTFMGNMFVTTYNGDLLSNVVMVPEPSAAVLGALGLAGMRRREATAPPPSSDGSLNPTAANEP